MREKLGLKLGVVVAVAAAGLVLTAASASAAITPNPWLDRHFLNIAHQGGEDEAPSNTMYAFKSAIREGHADMLEMDVHLTSDGHLVVIHDDTWTRTACLPALCPGPTSASEPVRPANQIRNMTLAEVQALDAGYWFRPGTYQHDYTQPVSAFPFRGIRTGEKAPPKGYTAEDFRIPTLEEVLKTFPHTPTNIEIKMPKSYDPVNPYPATCGNKDGSAPGTLCDDLDLTEPTTRALADLLNSTPRIPTAKRVKKHKRCVAKRKAASRSAGTAKVRKCTKPRKGRRNDIIVVAFSQEPMEMFAQLAPTVHRAPSLPSLSGYAFQGKPLVPDPVAFQVPPLYGGVKAPKLLLGQPFFAHESGYAVHVWTDGPEDETDERYREMLDLGVDGIMTTSPRKLNAFLCANKVAHPNGTTRCATKKPKKKRKGGKK